MSESSIDESVVIALLQQSLSEMDKKLDNVIRDHEQRLRSVEKWMYAVPVAALVAVGSMAAAVISAFR